jgi:chromosome segregation ATPase
LQDSENAVAEIRALSEKLQFELGDAILDNQKINDRFVDLTGKYENLIIKLQKTETSRTDLETQLSDVEILSNKLRTKLVTFQHENDRLKEELDNEKMHAMKLDEERAVLLFKIQESKEKLDSLEKNNEKLSFEIETTRKQLTEALACLESNRNNSENLVLAQRTLEKELNEARSYTERLTIMLKECQIEKKDVSGKLDQSSKHVLTLEKEISILRSRLEESNELRDNLMKKNEALTLHNETVQKQLLDAIDLLEVSKKQTETLQTTQILLERQLHEVQSFSETQSMELEQLRHEKQSMKIAFEDTQSNLIIMAAKCSTLEEQKDISLLQIENLEKDLCNLQNDLKLKIQDANEFKQTKNELETLLHEAQSNSEILKVEIRELELKNQRINNELNESTKTCKKLGEDKKLLSSKLEEFAEKCRNIEEKFAAEEEHLQNKLLKTIDSLESNKIELEQAQTARMNLATRLAEAEGLKATLKDELDEIKFKNNEINKELNKAHENLVTLQKEKRVLLEEVGTLKEENEKVVIENVTLCERMSEISIDLTSEKAECKKLKETVCALEASLKEVNASSEFVKCELGTVQHQLEESQKKCEELKAEKVSLEKQVEELRTVQDVVQNNLNEAEKCSRTLRSEVENLYGENCNMKDTLKQTRQYSKNLEKQKESLTVQLKDCETTKQELQVELDDLQKEISKVKSNLGEHKRVQESLEKKLVESDAFIENIQEEKHKISEILTHVKNENAILISKMEASNEKCTNLIRESSAIAASLELCRKELEESKEFRAGLETVLEKLTTERDKLAFERQQEIARLNESEKCRQELNNEKEILTSKLSTLENDNDELLSQIDILQRRIQELNDVAIKRELESQKSEETLTELLKEKRELSDNVDVLSNKNEELLCQNNDFQNQLSEAARNCKELTNVFNSEKEILTSKLIHLEGKSSTLENDNDKLLSQIDILQKQILDLKDVAIKRDLESQKNEETLTELLKEKRELLDKVDTLLKKNEELLCQNDYFQKQLVTVEGYYKELTNVKNTLDEQLHEMSNLSETLKVESEELRLQYQKSKTELDYSRDTLLKLTNEKENLAVMLKDAKEMNDELQKEILQVTNNLESNEQRRSDLEKQQVEVIRTLEQTKSENEKLLQRITEVEKTSSENRAVLEEEVNSLTSMTVKYKDELESTLKRMEESEQSLRDVQQQILTLDVKLKEVNEEKYVLEKKIELEEILSSESNEKIKSLEETVQDYEITISGLKNVVDSNLERLEALKEKLLFKKNEEFYAKKAITDLLQDYNIIWDEGEEKDLKMFISENVRKILTAKIQEGEKQRTELENEIEELKIKSTTAINLNASFQDMIEKLQTLVMDQSEVDSMDALKSNFDKVHSKINAIFQIKQKLSDDLCRSEERNVELIGQLENIKLEKKKLDESKTCLERNLAEEKEKTANLRKELEQKSKPNRPEKENILGVSTKVNKTREEELKKENMVLKRKLVLTENAKNNLEKVLKELREKNKTQETSSSPTSDALYKKLLQEYIQVKEENECIQKENDAKYQELLRDNEQLKLKTIQIKSEDDKKIIQDLQNVREAYGNVMSINSKLELEVVTLRKVIEEQNSEVVNLAHIKEAYERLLEENNKISTDIDTMKYKRMRDKEEFVRLLKKEREETVNREMKKIQEIRTEYEGKLEKMKEKMLKLYREEVNKKVKSVKDGQGETANMLKTVANLREELFEADQKIQLLEMEKEILKANKKLESETKTFQLQTIASVTTVARNEEKAATLPRPSVTEEITISRRTSVGGLPNNIDTHNLQMEDEEDLFNDKYLSDLKEGKCLLPTDRECTTNRFSELAWRNSMVPPHLKSSYPAEMQFISPNRFKDEDIKVCVFNF